MELRVLGREGVPRPQTWEPIHDGYCAGDQVMFSGAEDLPTYRPTSSTYSRVRRSQSRIDSSLSRTLL